MTDLTKSIANDFLGNGKISSGDDDLKSLTELADQPKKLHRTLFKIIEKKQIKKMLPPILKKMKTSTVRQLCLEKLEHMSKASIVSMIIGDATPTSSRHSEREVSEYARPSTGTESQKRDHIETEIAKSASRDSSRNPNDPLERMSPSLTAGLRTNDSPNSSSWTSGSGKHRWSRSPSIDKTPLGTPRAEANNVQDQSAVRTNESTSTWLEDLDTDELELRARALRSLSNRLDRLQGRVPEQDSSS